MKQERIGALAASTAARGGWADSALAQEVVETMEQGILVWGGDGRCAMYNLRVHTLLELSPGDLQVGTTRADFRARSLARKEMPEAELAAMEKLVQARQPYSFDRRLPSGRVVLTHGRPTREGGYVVTFTDVSEARRAAHELEEARRQAEQAEIRATTVLAQERARQDQNRMLSQLDEWLQSCKSLDELYRVVSKFMGRLLPASMGELYIYSSSRDALDGKCSWNSSHLHGAISADSCWSLRRGRTYAYEAEGLCFSCDHVTAHGHPVPAEEYLCIPIVAHGDTVGLLHIRFDSAASGAARMQSHAEFAQRCGEHISMAIANARLRDELRDQSIRDPLTGLYNRRYFLDAIRREVTISERRGSRFGLISFDADQFKTFNDNHGHDAGDMVLRAIGAKLQEVMLAGEIPCRFGGEEFMVLVPAAGCSETLALAERLREAVSLTQVRHVDRILPSITISAGIVSYPDHGLQPADLLKRADEALYAAKQAGRNCVHSG